jgi:hypothetical protein
MGFDVRAAEAFGLAVGVCALVWLAGRFVFRKTEKPPVLSLPIFSVALGLWIAAQAFYPSHVWTGHLGAFAIFFGSAFGWVVFDRAVSVGLLEKRRGVAMPIILRQHNFPGK